MDPLDLVTIEGFEFGVGQDIVVIRESRIETLAHFSHLTSRPGEGVGQGGGEM